MLKIGDRIEDFELLDGDKKAHKLSDYLGKKLILYFYPKNNTPGCTMQACSFRDNYEIFKENNIEIVGISKGDSKSHLKFKKDHELPFVTLSDPEFKVIKYFGLDKAKSMFGKPYTSISRTTFLINEEGIIINILENVDPKDSSINILNEFK